MRIIVNPDRFITGCIIPMLTLVKEESLCWRSFLRAYPERVDIQYTKSKFTSFDNTYFNKLDILFSYINKDKTEITFAKF